MSFDFCLYRAEPGAPPLLHWQRNHALPLGPLADVRARLDRALAGLRWSEARNGQWVGSTRACHPPVAVILWEATPGCVHFVDTDAPPPVLRLLMTALALNHCCMPDSGEMRDPFSVGASWDEACAPDAGRRGTLAEAPR